MAESRSVLTDMKALLARRSVHWAILILLLFGQANQARLYGDSIPYAVQARAMADSGEFCRGWTTRGRVCS